MRWLGSLASLIWAALQCFHLHSGTSKGPQTRQANSGTHDVPSPHNRFERCTAPSHTVRQPRLLRMSHGGWSATVRAHDRTRRVAKEVPRARLPPIRGKPQGCAAMKRSRSHDPTPALRVLERFLGGSFRLCFLQQLVECSAWQHIPQGRMRPHRAVTACLGARTWATHAHDPLEFTRPCTRTRAMSVGPSGEGAEGGEGRGGREASAHTPTHTPETGCSGA